MASKQRIKETLDALCKIIIHNGGTKITPETFRLAKFDKNEATRAMWILLFETVWYLNFSTFRTTEDFNDDKAQEVIFWTKHELFTTGYYVKDFYQLPEDMGYGSREILLAFGWLMSKSKILHTFLQNCNNIFEECLPIDWESLIGSSTPTCEKSYRISRNFSHEAINTKKSTDLDQLSWTLGNLMLNFKGLFTAETQLASLVGKVHASTQGAEMPKGHLSVLEVFLLRHPKELTKFLEKTQQYNTYLESLLKFVELQDILWKWLESVYEAKVSKGDSERLTWDSKAPCGMCCEISNQKLSDLWKTQHEIQKTIRDNEKQCRASKQAQLDGMQALCQVKLQELNEKLETLALEEKPQASLTEKQTFPELKHIATDNRNMKQSEQSCAQKEIDVLKQEISELELKLLELKNEHFDILNNLVGHLEEYVFIPPIGKSKYTELMNK